MHCTGPVPTPAAKKARDDLLVKRAAKIGHNEGRKTRRLASAASAELISDDENEDSDDLIHAYVDIQSIFVPANEMNDKSFLCSCLMNDKAFLSSLANLPYSVSVYSS